MPQTRVESSSSGISDAALHTILPTNGPTPATHFGIGTQFRFTEITQILETLKKL